MIEATLTTTDSDRTYHHGNLRTTLLRTAFEHLRQVGVEKISLRALARDVGVSQTAPYRHFPNKNLLLVAMAVEGFRQMEQHLRQVTRTVEEGDRALMVAAEGYIAFAEKNPELYRLMFGPTIRQWREPEYMTETPNDAFNALVEIIEKAVEQGKITDEHPTWFLAKSCWATVHGHAMMAIDGLLDKGMPDDCSFDLTASLQISLSGKMKK